MNWVEQRHRREAALEAGAPELWNKVRAAIQDACESYNRLYGSSDAKKVKCEPENGRRLRIEKRIREMHSPSAHRDDNISMLISFEVDPPRIVVTGDSPVTKGMMPIYSTENAVFLGTAAAQIEVDSLSEKILTPLLFPTEQYCDPF